jgi:hypothetical protein
MRSMTSSSDLLTNPDDPRHGTQNGYCNHGCRCQRCRASNAAYQQGARQRRQDFIDAGRVPDHVHGTENGYGNYRCRCDPCTKAHAENAKAIYHRRKR